MKVGVFMIRDVTLVENNFISIFSDAVILYEAAVSAVDEELKSALVKSSILTVNYALEAAANSFVSSIELDDELKGKVDRYSTLEKFGYVVNYHTGKSLPSGAKIYQQVRNLITRRNQMVHPKVNAVGYQVRTTGGGGEPFMHTVIKKAPKIGASQNPKLLGDDPELYTVKDAQAALQAMTSFLNLYVEEWWGIGYENANLFLYQTWDGSIGAMPYMFRPHQIKVLIRNKELLDVRFIGIHGMISLE